MIRIGPAGWLYEDWNGTVYPADGGSSFDPLAYVARYFDTVEVNSSFYGPPTPETARRWVERVAENPAFRFTAKLWRRFTHERTSAWTAAEVAEARAGNEVLLEAGLLGALLLQFPWSFRRTDENREWLNDVIATFADFPLAVEVRHDSWNDPEYFRELADRNVGFVNIDQPLYGDSIAPAAHATAPVGYIRVHGRNYREWWRHEKPHDRYNYLYTADELEPWAERAREIDGAGAVQETFVITNNHFRGKAVANGLMLRSMVERRPVAAPEPVREAFGEVLAGFLADE